MAGPNDRNPRASLEDSADEEHGSEGEYDRPGYEHRFDIHGKDEEPSHGAAEPRQGQGDPQYGSPAPRLPVTGGVLERDDAKGF